MLPKGFAKWLALGYLGLTNASVIPLTSLFRRQTVTNPIPADDISLYTINHFIDTRRVDINSPDTVCVFYTREGGVSAKRITEQNNQLVTLWDVWPCELYNRDTEDANNRLRKIMSSKGDTQTYFENMSKAYAFMCSNYANLITPDINKIPVDGIWGRVEEPTIIRVTDFDPPKGKIDLVDAFTLDMTMEKTIFDRPGSQKRDQGASFQRDTNTTSLTRRSPPGNLPNCVPADKVDELYGDLGW